MKRISYFIKYVELKTKVASLFPFLIAYLYYINYLYENGINYLNFIIFFISMICFDMLTTAINHYNAFKTETKDQSEYDQGILKQMKELNISMKTNKNILIILFIIAAVCGIILVFLSNIGVLLLGMLCFLIGILYSSGPKPISHTFLGELFAGGTMGILLPVIAIFTQYDYIPFQLNPFLILVFVPLAFLIANILLANNTSDLEKDINNNRKTIVAYIGKNKAVTLLHVYNILAYLFIIIAWAFNFLNSWIFLLMILTYPITFRNINIFKKDISKQRTFKLIVNNFILFSIAYILLFVINLFVN